MKKLFNKAKTLFKKAFTALKPYTKLFTVMFITYILFSSLTNCLAREPTTANAQEVYLYKNTSYMFPDVAVYYSPDYGGTQSDRSRCWIRPAMFFEFSVDDEGKYEGAITIDKVIPKKIYYMTGNSKTGQYSFNNREIPDPVLLSSSVNLGNMLVRPYFFDSDPNMPSRWGLDSQWTTSTQTYTFRQTLTWDDVLFMYPEANSYGWVVPNYFEYYAEGSFERYNLYFDIPKENDIVPVGTANLLSITITGGTFQSATYPYAVKQKSSVIRFHMSENVRLGYEQGFYDGYFQAGKDGVNVPPFKIIVNAIDDFFNIQVLPGVRISTIFSLSFGLLLLGLALKIFLGG